MAQHIILHLDMDYFYAQIEERDNPTLKGKPVVVCMVSAREGSLGAIATCNYEARKLGLHAGMPCFLAKTKAPHGVYIPARREYYTMVSDSIMEALRGYADTLEQVSVDEAYMDVSTKVSGYEGLIEYVKAIKDSVLKRENLTCSIGAGPNKLIAKMASKVNKPDGYKIIPPAEVDSFIISQPVSKILGVGEKTQEKLAELGIRTVADLRNLNRDELTREFGQGRGKLLYESARGEDESQVVERVKEQYGRLASLKRDSRDTEEMNALIDSLTSDVHSRLLKNNMAYKTVSTTFVLENMETKTKSRTLQAKTQNLDVLRTTAKGLLREFLAENPTLIRRLGVTASGLAPSAGQKSITDY